LALKEMVIEIDKSQADKFKQSTHDLDCDTDEARAMRNDVVGGVN